MRAGDDALYVHLWYVRSGCLKLLLFPGEGCFGFVVEAIAVGLEVKRVAIKVANGEALYIGASI